LLNRPFVQRGVSHNATIGHIFAAQFKLRLNQDQKLRPRTRRSFPGQ